MQHVSGGLLDRLVQLIETNGGQPEADGLSGSVSSKSSGKSPGPAHSDVPQRLTLNNDYSEASRQVPLESSNLQPSVWTAEPVSGDPDFQVTPSMWEIRDGFFPTLADHSMFSSQTPSQDLLRPQNDSLPQLPPMQEDISSLNDYCMLELQSPGLQADMSPTSQGQSFESPASYSLIAPDHIVEHLVDLFFERVTLPLLHRPRFYKQHLRNHNQGGKGYQDLPLESAFILNGLMSLSARFSHLAYWSSTPPTLRGERFAKEAQRIYADATRAEEDRTPTLAYLQACIVLAFYHQSNGPTAFGWTLTGVVTRLAYDLNLNNLDEDSGNPQDLLHQQWASAEDWTSQEESRRAWWSAWEIDTYASTVSHRPYSFSPSAIHVFLPVSDEHWFASKPIASAPMGSTLDTAWKSLQRSANQDERAWFLISNFMMRLACELAVSKEVSREAKWRMDCALSCFSLSLPEHFRATSGPLIFDDKTFRKSNWITATNIMLQSARTYATLTMSTDELTNASGMPHNNIMSNLEERISSLQQCEQHANQIIRSINGWSPDYMAYCSPNIICALFGPACLHFLSHSQNEVGRINRELVGLVFAQFARYWNIGALMLGLMHKLEKLDVKSRSSFDAPGKESLTKRFAGILPEKESTRAEKPPDNVSARRDSTRQNVNMAA